MLAAAVLVFLSYAHQDAPAAAGLALDLAGRGCVVWVDREQLRAGDDWTRRIERAIDRSDVVAVLITRHSSRSRWVRREVLRAQRRRKRIVPIYVDGDTPLPLEGLQTVTPTKAASAIGCN